MTTELAKSDASATSATNTTTGDSEHRFNDDIGLDNSDVDFLMQQFPEIAHVLNCPELRHEFLKHESVARASRQRVQKIGLTAIALAAAALMAAAAKPVLLLVQNLPPSIGWILVTLELLALIAAVITLGGFSIDHDKVKWLEGRMITEILRAWHFQFLIYKGKEIELSCANDESRASFQTRRHSALDAFIREWTGKADSYYDNLIENADVQYVPLHHDLSNYSENSVVLESVFRAYRMLRFQHQLIYTTHKLKRTTHRQFWQILKLPTRILQDRTTLLARICVLASLGFSFVVVLFHILGKERVAMFASVMIIVLLIVNVIARTVQDGLAVPKELERYRDYQQKTRYLMQRFDLSSDANEKLALMRDMERAVIEELRSFLRANDEARFII